MTDDAARVLADCAANPDDDAPRLVWADLVGGERGELVVIQCDLARGGLSVPAARARRVRERELLEKHAVAWAGGLARIATRWSFRRGFVEAAKLSLWELDPAALRDAPLLTTVMLDPWSYPEGSFARAAASLTHLRGLGLYGTPLRLTDLRAALSELPRFRALRAFAYDGLDASAAPPVIEALRTWPIERLQLRDHRLDASGLAAVLAAAPELTALELWPGPSIEVPIAIALQQPLHALRLGRVRFHDLMELAGSPAGATLEHLGFELVGQPPEGLGAMLARIHTLELGGVADAVVRAVLATELPALRVLRITGALAPELARALAERLGDRLELVDRPPIADELLHAEAAALLTTGRPWCEMSQPACFVRVDQAGGPIFDLPPAPADERLRIGRSRQIAICLPSGTVARHHAELTWRDGHHVIRDLRSTNGIIVGTRRVADHVLADGDELMFGDVIVRYFVGPGCRERAEAAVR